MADDPANGGTKGANGGTEPSAAEIKRQARQREPRFTAQDVLDRPGIMDEDGYSVFDIALGLANVDPDADFTRAEIRAKVTEALARPVEHVHAHDDDTEEG